MKEIKAKRGFTIIEVVLVLAIAGLIFLMVFIALPALQRGQRDTQRRDDVARVMSQLNSYQTNNRGRIPDAESENAGDFTTMVGVATVADDAFFLDAYMKRNDEEFNDPQSGNMYGFRTDDSGALADTDTMAYSGPGYQCNGEAFVDNDHNRSVAVRIKLEGSGFYCQDNQ